MAAIRQPPATTDPTGPSAVRTGNSPAISNLLDSP